MNSIAIKKLSIVIPLYKSEGTIEQLLAEIETVVSRYPFYTEIVLVSDGCDNSWNKINNIVSKTLEIRKLKLVRNFGQHAAILAGLKKATGNWLMIMDADYQDSPEEISKLVGSISDSTKVIIAVRKNRQDKLFRRLTSKLFFNTLSYLTETKFDSRISNFGIYHCSIVQQYLSLKERKTAFTVYLTLLGCKINYVKVNHNRRSNGRSSYNLRKRLSLASNIITSFSDKPLRLIIKFGFTIVFLSIMMIVYFIFNWVVYDSIVEGWTSLIVSIWFLGGVTLTTLGVIAQYLATILNEVKARPTFIIEEERIQQPEK